MLHLAHEVYCLDQDPATGDDLLLPKGKPVRNLQRVGEADEFGADWSFEATTDGGRTWREFATVLDLELRSPVE